jgi:hypothetical protein
LILAQFSDFFDHEEENFVSEEEEIDSDEYVEVDYSDEESSPSDSSRSNSSRSDESEIDNETDTFKLIQTLI